MTKQPKLSKAEAIKEIPLNWLEPLSKLIPILFEKEGE